VAMNRIVSEMFATCILAFVAGARFHAAQRAGTRAASSWTALMSGPISSL
jgi:hypothetical protein